MMPGKRTAEEEGEEPASKQQRTEESWQDATGPKEPGEVKLPAAVGSTERELDDKDDGRPAVTEKVCFPNTETTLNVVTTTGGRVLMSMSEGGMQFLIAGARANVGIASGRYFYEVKVVEALTPLEGRNPGRSRVPMPRQLVRIGFSLGKSSLVLGDGGDSCVCFDSEGFFFADKKRTQASTRFGRDQDVGVLLNVDQGSPNANTVSLFCNGQRISEPMPLPEKLRGQPLFPHVAYRNVTLQVNFGPTPMSPLKFKSRMLQSAAAADVQQVPLEKPKDGKYDVVFPVGFPDEGTFDWLDDFLEKHPGYVELSDRKILDWALKSGIWKPSSNSWKHSNDKPEFNFGVQYMDDFSIKRCINAITCVVPRNYVVMEVKQNLTPADRKANLSRFRRPCFRKIAQVVMGEPTSEYKGYIQKKILEDKRAKSEVDWKLRKLERERKKALSQRQDGLAGEAVGEKADGAEGDEPMPQAELTEEEKKLNFRPPAVSDIAPSVLNSSFSQFCIPEKEEGFDEVRFEWQGEESSKAYLRKWVLERKLTSRMEDLQPGDWFRTKYAEFQRCVAEWQAKQRAFGDVKRFEHRRPEGEEEDFKMDDLDIDTLQNICDMGNGEPLFANFQFEDWTLLALRYELYLLQAAFAKDADDPERPGVPEQHLGFYYSKYFKKQLIPRLFGRDTPAEVVELAKDVVKFDPESGVLVSVLPQEPQGPDSFVKSQEESRRKRQQRIEAGDETARLNFQQPSELQWSLEQPVAPQPPPPQYKGGGKDHLWPTEPAQPPPPHFKGSGGKDYQWSAEPAQLSQPQFKGGGGQDYQWQTEPAQPPPPPFQGGGGQDYMWSAEPAQAQPPQFKGGGGGKDMSWPPAKGYSKGGGKANVPPTPAPAPAPAPAPLPAPTPGDMPGGGPRLVPPPRPQPQQAWPPQQQPQQDWPPQKGGGGKSSGKWGQNYAPRLGKGGKKG